MVLAASLTTLDGLSEDEAKHYVEKDGEFVLGVKSVNGLELANVQGLRNTVKTLRGEKESLESTVKNFDGVDPISAKDALAKVKQIEEGQYEFDKDEAFNKRLESERNKMAQKHTAEIDGVKNENQTLRSQLKTIFVDNVATTAISQKKANVRLLLPHMVSRMDVEEFEPGKFRTMILDKDGQKDIDGQGQSVSVDSLMSEMELDFPEAFPGPGSSGLGGGDDKKGGDPAGKKVVKQSDKSALNNNIEDIASGKVVVNVDE